jgi:hypothetical protein
MVTKPQDSNSDGKALEAKIEEIMEPFESRGIVKKRNYNGRKIWGTSVSYVKLMQAIVKGIEKNGEDPNTLIINGQKVLLAILPFIMFYKSYDESDEDRNLDAYLIELSSE